MTIQISSGIRSGVKQLEVWRKCQLAAMWPACCRYLKFSDVSQYFRNLILHICHTVIAWRKKLFRKNFGKEEAYIQFHLLLACSLEAPRESIAELIQEELVVWLKDVGEQQAAEWYKKTWTGEHGNYTNA